MSRHLNGILSGPATNLDDGLSPHFPPDVLSHNCFEPTPTVMRALLGRVSISAAESSKEVIGNSAADEAHNVGSPEDDSRRAMHNVDSHHDDTAAARIADTTFVARSMRLGERVVNHGRE